MEEKKLSVEIAKRDLSQHVQKIDASDSAMKIGLLDNSTSKMYAAEGPNDNWFELRFSTVGPDRRGYHSSFMHNKK